MLFYCFSHTLAKAAPNDPLALDESAEEKAGGESAGAGCQHNGRLEKIEMSQMGVFLALVTPKVCTWLNGELYFPQAWFEESHAELRKKTGMPEELTGAVTFIVR